MQKDHTFTNKNSIPKEYLINDRDTRLKVLAGIIDAGIIDTDGHVSKEQNGKRVSISQSNIQLSQDIIYLIRSLGFVINYSVRQRKNESIFNQEKKDYKDQYVINISGELLHEIPTILPRKKCVSTKSNKDYLRTSISVNHIGKGKYFGWIVDKNHRFVLDDSIGHEYYEKQNSHKIYFISSFV
jgi:hypothetical protein